MCAYDGDDPATVYRGEQRTARKRHTCSECGRGIMPGERYENVGGLWDGRWQTFKTCAHCREAQRWLIHQCRGFLHGGTLEDVCAHWDEDTILRSVAFGRLVVLAGGTRRRGPWKRKDGTLVLVQQVTALVDGLVA